VIDITGGAPELNPNLATMIPRLAALAERIMIRSNLTSIADHDSGTLLQMFKEYKVAVVASLPSLNPSQLDGQRGSGAFRKSIETLLRLNTEGFGQPESGLELNLVANPTGAFLPAPQAQLEKKFRNDLQRKWGIVFNKLFTFSNVPLGRFRSWLESSGNLDGYLHSLASSFNPCTVPGLMCRSLLSVSWDGYIYDCDFNLAQGIPAGNVKTHVSQTREPPSPGAAIAVSDLCYACTAGSGFT
jgi:radical SAM/Cys-rich protein